MNENTAPKNDLKYTVVRNHEEQYSIWRDDRPAPAGWQEVAVTGSREQCLTYIEGAWHDLRPASLRNAR
jgi:MbtH protein